MKKLFVLSVFLCLVSSRPLDFDCTIISVFEVFVKCMELDHSNSSETHMHTHNNNTMAPSVIHEYDHMMAYQDGVKLVVVSIL
jgi:L-fucose mutarotase/ribose pyranase (RbsD/FucU family)